jgi:hypothetical protein
MRFYMLWCKLQRSPDLHYTPLILHPFGSHVHAPPLMSLVVSTKTVSSYMVWCYIFFPLEKSSWHYWYLEELSQFEGKPCNPLTHTHTPLSLYLLDLLHVKPFGLCPFLLKFKSIISSIPNTANGDKNKMVFLWWLGLGVMNYNLAYRGIRLWWRFAFRCSFYLWYYTSSLFKLSLLFLLHIFVYYVPHIFHPLCIFYFLFLLFSVLYDTILCSWENL